MYKVLIIEDDRIMGEMLAMYLKEEGFQVERAVEGDEGLELAKKFSPHVIILDMVLPDKAGTQLCRELRTFTVVPILVVSMKTGVAERVEALTAGADDYVCKPFSLREVTAKISAMIRRTHLYQDRSIERVKSERSTARQEGAILLDLEKRVIRVNNGYVEATFSEFEIMRLFMTNVERVYSREDLLNELRGYDSFVTERAIDVHIANLRKKIEDNPKEPKYIKTVWGIGYKFVTKSS
ncbi:response regulator transcription factor [Paenibacillus sp. L3-i20]|uniref:response regulator transcription factor n=1 Tax=Paenibacillus sp. L3-i20 TaxID=2905833 RepID=UPI001EDDEFEA|nr:response regulator transcription factor [Paenibacillus sp. L3-i20]GKU77431.1 DNA-binding response regulator [Paenibacillus sp. L3-i20]